MNCKKISPCFLVVLLAFIVMPVFAETITVYNSYSLVLERASVDESFSSIISGDGTAVQTHTDTFVSFTASTTSNQFQKLRRTPLAFPISESLPKTAVIDSAILYLRGTGKTGDLGTDLYFTFSGITVADKTSFTKSDYSGVANTPLTSSVSYADWLTTGYNAFTLNSDGLGYISRDSATVFCVRHSWDITGNFGGSWSRGNASGLSFRTNRYTGTTSDPYIVITYHIPAPEVAYSCTPRTGTAPLTITCTDASSNTPTSWAWDFGDGNTSTLQNPEHTYDFAGTFDVNLSVSNAGGSDHELKLDYVEVTAAATPTPTPTVTVTETVTSTTTVPVTTTVIPTTIPILSGSCQWVNLTGATIEPNSTSWENSINVTRWGMLITNATAGNVSWYTCLDEFRTPTPAPTGIPNFPASQIDPFSVLAKTVLENLWLGLVGIIAAIILAKW